MSLHCHSRLKNLCFAGYLRLYKVHRRTDKLWQCCTKLSYRSLVSSSPYWSYGPVPYAKSLEMFGLSFKALEVSFQAITIPSISHSAARSIDKLIRSSALIALHPEEIAQAIHQLISSRVEISDKVVIVEGYTFLVAQSLGKEEIPRHISPVFQAFANLDLESCDSALALEALKVCFAVGRTLYTTAPGKVDALAWTDGVGLEMVDWVGRSVAMFSRRFPEDFEVIEVFPRTGGC